VHPHPAGRRECGCTIRPIQDWKKELNPEKCIRIRWEEEIRMHNQANPGLEERIESGKVHPHPAGRRECGCTNKQIQK